MVVKTTGGLSRLAQQAYPMVTAGVASYLWVQSGIAAGVGFATVVGLLQLFLIWVEGKARKTGPSPGWMWVQLAAGCFWITAASAATVAMLMRTVGAPVLEAAATCYVVALGSAGMGGIVQMAREDAARRR